MECYIKAPYYSWTVLLRTVRDAYEYARLKGILEIDCFCLQGL